jgi:hypothetical protein
LCFFYINFKCFSKDTVLMKGTVYIVSYSREQIYRISDII